MNETQAAILHAIRRLQRHPNNPWQEELQDLQARAKAGEDITVEAIDLLSQNENVRLWMREQVPLRVVPRVRGVSDYQGLPGRSGTITASDSWVCPVAGCTESLPVIQAGEDPPTCEKHGWPMVPRKK